MSQTLTSPERAPSDTRTEQPTLARLLGMFGLFFFVSGAVSVTAVAFGYTGGLISQGFGYLLGTVGLLFLLIHAACDGDIEIRRIYGVGLALLPLLAAVVVSFYPGKPGAATAREMCIYFLPWGFSIGFVSLLFFVPFARQETEEPIRTWIRYLMLAVGAALALAAVGVGIFKSELLVGPGLAMALLGFGFLAAYLSLVDTSAGPGRTAALGVGVLGAVALAVAFGRTVAPTVLFEGPAALKNTMRGYDTIAVLGRGVAVLFSLGLAGLALVRTLPLWIRSAAAVAGAAAAALFVVGSFTTVIHTTPPPYLVPYGLALAAIGGLYLTVSVIVCSDSPLVAIVTRELTTYFYSPIAYIVLFAVAAMSSVGYLLFVLSLIGGAGSTNSAGPLTRQFPNRSSSGTSRCPAWRSSRF
ncbi:hypothetical protein [Fimbriiglobus ruber]|uniref:Uncharacterized protein n=1 Tax=Fimbriiglobus ruber TaxID=1908690 RepID=A0A225DSP3_9BACT|nr:hypothetical protein [Fimbriiglobus ruber]OWK44331.1 hypothetical protein FRUB_02263 [Fimbriiglobus ruber]